MKRLKSLVRIILLSVAIILTAAGAGIFGAMMPVYRDRFMNNEIRIEMVDKKKTKEENEKTKE